MAITSTENLINSFKDEIIALITKLFTEVTHNKFNYKTGWEVFESEAQKTLGKFLFEKFPKSKVKIPNGKNEYPDISLETEEGLFAIDIKVSVGEKTPEFDMARLDTIIRKRIDVFVEEWEIVIKYDKTTGNLLNVYFGLFREIAGIQKLSGGVKYRRYDGKLRPKSWNDFEANKIYWTSKEEFLEAIKKSFDYRWTSLISNDLVPNTNEEEKIKYKSLFDNPIPLPEEIDDEEEIDD